MIFNINSLKAEYKKDYIILDTYENFEDARLNRAKLSSLIKELK